MATTPHVQNKTIFEQLIEMWAALPIWAPVVGAAGVYGVLAFAFPQLPYVHYLSGLAPLAAIVILVTGMVGWITKLEHHGTGDKTNTKGFVTLKKLKWEQFEPMLADAYRRRGYAVDESAASAHDFVDFVLRKNGETTYVQAKHWKSNPVDINLLRDLYRSMSGEAHRWVVVATNGFTDAAKEWVRGRDIQLVDGDDLLALLGSATATVTAPAPVALSSATAPLCPVCGAAMVSHINHHSGASFWGCPKFPKCMGTREA